MPEPLLTTTTLSIDGYRIVEYKGLVRGIVVRAMAQPWSSNVPRLLAA